MNRTQWIAPALAAAIGLAPLCQAAPAQAGSITVKVTPKGKKVEKLKAGLERLGELQARRNRARVDQKGSGNSASVSQDGGGNWLGVFQRGSGHTAVASQNGNNNALGIFQFGKNTSTRTAQTGDGQVGLIFQAGW
jgi:Curlin associated repeat